MNLRFVQIVDALDFGDAVSNQVIRIHQMLIEKGEYAQIFSKYTDHRVEKYRQSISEFKMDDDTVILHHFCGYSEVANIISFLRGYKILIYHNITPHKFFDEQSPLHHFCQKGREQLRQIIDKYNLILGDSLFNCQEAESLGANNVKEFPIIVPNFSQKPIAPVLVKEIRANYDHVWLFVGRIAPNKRQDILVEIFSQYITLYPEKQHHLYLVGKYSEEDIFYQQVCSKINTLGVEQHVTLVGKVEDEYLPAYYHAADIFVCMSEHEGFCVPIVEAFNSQIPVVAYAKTAVANTMLGSPGALSSLNKDNVVELIHAVFTNNTIKNQLIAHGIQQSKRFAPDVIRQSLYSIIEGIKYKNHHKQPLKVSVVICTCNRKDYLHRCLTYLQDQDYPHFEVIVVNGPSTDDTMEILENRNNIKLVQNPQRNLSISRNLGIQQAAGDIVAFIDDDALPYDNWLSEIVKRYNKLPSNVVGVGGRTFFANQFKFQFEQGIVDVFGTHTEIFHNDQRKYSYNFYRHLLGTNCSFRKDALININGFDEQYDYYLDETDTALRLQKFGGLIVNANAAYVRHEFAQSHNRLGKYNFNWKVIAKNTAYFGIKNASPSLPLYKIVWQTSIKILQERCLSFISAWLHQDLGLKEALQYSYSTIMGTLRGYYDACFPRKFPDNLHTVESSFLPYIQNFNDQESMEVTSSSNIKLHILIISQEFPPHSFGGIGAYNQTLARELMQMGHEVTVISRGSRDCTDIIGSLTHIQIASVEYSDYLPETPILSKNLAWAIKVAKIAQEIHQERPISIIESALWDFEGLGVLMLRPEFKVPLIVRLVTPLLVAVKMNSWQMTEDIKKCIQIEQELIRVADCIIPISNSIQNSVASAYNLNPDHRWHTQPLGVQPWPTYTNISNYGELPKDLKRGTVQILFVGRLEARKGIDVFIKALKLIMPQQPKIHVWIAGQDIEGWEEKTRRILSPDVQNRIQFLGLVSEERRELLYANCDFLVFPSRYESFGLVPLEVMVHGKPVIGAKAGAIPEVVIDGECGLLFEPDNHKDLAQKIVTLIKDEKLIHKLAIGAKKRVEVLSARNMAKASVALYRSLLNEDLPLISVNESISNDLKNKFLFLGTEKNNPAVNHNKNFSINNRQFDDMNIRLDWSLTTPKIISWGWLNYIFNSKIVPKLVKFIQSVMFESMQRQTQINNLLISRNQILENEIHLLKQNMVKEEQKSAWLLQEIERIFMDKSEAQLTKFTANVEEGNKNIEIKLRELQQDIEEINNRLVINHDNFIEDKQTTQNQLFNLKELIYELQRLTSVENEMSRSEFAYKLKTQNLQEPRIISSEKIIANVHNLCLNLGCGQVIIPDYINVDQRELPEVDVIADVTNLPFKEGTIAEIYNAHVIEHFTEYEVKTHILPYWYSLLRDGGKIVIICPDAESMIIDYVKSNYSWDNLRKVTYGSQDYEGNYHYNMYTTESLSQILSSCGFKEVTVVDTKRVNGLCYEMEIHGVK